MCLFLVRYHVCWFLFCFLCELNGMGCMCVLAHSTIVKCVLVLNVRLKPLLGSAGFWRLRCVNALPDHMDGIVLGGWYPLTVALLLPPLLTHSICLFPPLFLAHSATLLHSALLEMEISLFNGHHDTSTYIPNECITLLLLAGVKAGRCIRLMFSLGLLTEASANKSLCVTDTV